MPRRNKTKEKIKDGQEEMKNKLKEAGLYEEDMSTADMEKILKIVDDSKQLARKNDHSSQPDLYEVPSSPLSSYRHNDNNMSPTSNQEAKNNDLETSESSTAFHSNKLINRNSTNNEKAPPSQENLDNSSYSYYTISPSSDKKAELSFTRRTPTNQESRSYSFALFNQFEQWRINPLDCKQMENDVPLSRQKRSSVPRPKFQMVNGIPVIPDEIRNKQLTILDDTAELYHRFMQKPNNDEVQWGTPIKVGTANGSLDKYLISPSGEYESSVPEACNTTKEGGKFSLRSRHTAKKVTYSMSDDEEDEEIFQSKRKKVTDVIPKSSVTKNGMMRNKKNNVDSNKKKSDNQLSISKYDENDDLKIMPDETSTKKRSATPEYPEVSPVKPTPPSNKSNSYDVIVEVHNEEERQTPNSSRRNNDLDCEPIRSIKKRHEKLNDEEIEAQLITDDEDEEEKVIPLSSESRFSKRLRLGYSLLQNKRQQEDDERKQLEEGRRLAAEKEAYEKEEKMKQRIENNVAKAKQHEMTAKKRKEKEERYRNSVLRHQKYPLRTELESDELPKNEIMWDTNHESSETTHTQPEDNRQVVQQNENRVEEIQCPICGRDFPIDEVETHAGSCEAFADEDEQNSSHSRESEHFDYTQCDSFRTNDQKACEYHVPIQRGEISHNQHKKGEGSSKTVTKTSNTSIKLQARKRKR